MKKRISVILVMFLAVILCACSDSGSSDGAVSTPQLTPEPTPVPTLSPIEEFEEYLREAIPADQGGMNFVISRSGSTITLDCSGEDLDYVFSTVYGDYVTLYEKWDTMRNSAISTSNAILSDARKRDLSITSIVNLVDSKDTSNVYYSVNNGVEVFDAMDALPESNIVFYESSMYKVGVELEPGEYYVLPVDNSKSVYVCVTSDSNGDDIIDNSYQDGPHYITVEDGQYLTIKNGKFALASFFPANPKEVVSGDGMYLVGKDVVAGEYKLTNDSSRSGYWCIYSVSTANRKIVSNSLFDNAAYVTVSDGQYLLVTSCSGTLIG